MFPIDRTSVFRVTIEANYGEGRGSQAFSLGFRHPCRGKMKTPYRHVERWARELKRHLDGQYRRRDVGELVRFLDNQDTPDA